MTRTTHYTAWGLLATLAAAAAGPVLADGQSDKNNMRNLAIAGAAVAGYGLLNHNNTATLLGAAGAAIAGSQYEKDRKQQSQDSNWRYDRRYHRTDTNGYRSNGGNSYRNNGGGSGGGYYNGGGSYDANGGQWRSGSDNSQWRSGDNSNQWRNGDNNSQWRNGDNNSQWRNDYNSNRDYNNNYDRDQARHDNGRHLGWTKSHDRNNDDRH